MNPMFLFIFLKRNKNLAGLPGLFWELQPICHAWPDVHAGPAPPDFLNT